MAVPARRVSKSHSEQAAAGYYTGSLFVNRSHEILISRSNQAIPIKPGEMFPSANLRSQRPAFVPAVHLGYRPCKVLRSGPIRPSRRFITSSRRCRGIIAQMGKDPVPLCAKTLFTEDIARAESLFGKCVFSVPKGAAAMAASRDVDMPLIARAYGHVLAKSILDTIPVKLDVERLASACFSATEGRNDPLPLPPFVFEQWLASVKGSSKESSKESAKESSKVEQTDPKQLSLLSEMYGHMLGRTVRLTAFELDSKVLSEALKDKLRDPKASFPMDVAEYDKMFSNLEACATAVLGTSNLDSADRFFELLRAEADVSDAQGDGYILSVNGSFEASGDRSKAADLTQTVRFAWRVRLLDGRCLFLPNFSDGDEKEPDFYEAGMNGLTPAMQSVLLGMHPGETRTAFFHPYAALEVLEMLMPADQFPPQAGVVVDVYLKEIV